MDIKQTGMEGWVRQNRLIAILRGTPPELFPHMAEALCLGGACMAEVALNGENSLAQITQLRKAHPKLLVGAGTVLSAELAEAAIAAGAQFLLSPAAQEEVLAHCEKKGYKLLPGVFSPTDVALCLSYGFTTVKLFPANALPISYAQSLKSGPFNTTQYVAVGGVTCENAQSFIKAGCLGVGIGNALFPRALIQAQDFEGCAAHIKALCNSLTEESK